MQLPEILFSNASGFPGSGILISTHKPFNVGKVIKHDNNQKMDAFLSKWNLKNKCGIIPGYNILIYWIGTLDHVFEITPSGENVPDAVIPELKKMATFYETEHIKKSEKRFERYSRQ